MALAMSITLSTLRPMPPVQGYDSLWFHVDLVGYEANTDMRLDAFFREVEYRSCLQIALGHPECPFHIPETVVLGHYLLCVKVGVGHVSLQIVPLGVILYLLLVDGHLHVLADGQELVVATLVDGGLGEHAAAVCLAQSLNAFVAVVCVFLRPLL